MVELSLKEIFGSLLDAISHWSIVSAFVDAEVDASVLAEVGAAVGALVGAFVCFWKNGKLNRVETGPKMRFKEGGHIS